MWCSMCMMITFFPILTYSATLPNIVFTENQSPETSTPRLSLADSAEWTEYHVRDPEGPGTYSFGYDVEDAQTGNVQFRTEERRANGSVTGSYGYVTPEGNVHVVHYVADHLGYRAKIEDAKKTTYYNDNYKSSETSYENISPEMLAALHSLGNNNRFQKEDQRLRPMNSNSQNMVNSLVLPKKENVEEKKQNVYNVYFVPPNYKH